MKTPRFLILILCLLAALAEIRAEAEATQEIADRYEQLLVRSPQTGPAFDRVVDWYSTKGGGLEVLQTRWKTAAEKEPNSRPAYLVLQGLLAERLRTPDQARAFYEEAIKGGNLVQAAKLLAVLETTEGRFPEAAKAYEAALASESLAPVDRMELMRSLALLYQRSFDDAKALAVWQDALKRFPDDPYVLEEAGEAFLAGGNYAEATKAFTTLRDKSKSDPFRRVAASLRLARTAELEGKTDESVRIYELALEDTSEGSWINREVRNRIEELFRRKDDLPGLLAYYDKRILAVPQDYQALVAQGEVLEDLGRGSEAVERYRSAVKLAPDNVDLRLTLVRSLTASGQAEAAITEAEEMAKKSNVPPEALIVLGDLYWDKAKQSKDEKDKAAAIAAWKRIAPEDSTDVGSVARLADLLAAHDLTDEAMAQWQRIVTLSPAAADARQRMAEVLVKRDDKAGAQKILDDLVAGDRAQPENFLTLARIQDRMGWTDEARATTSKALTLFPKDYDVLTLAWRQAEDAGDAEMVKKLFPDMWKNAPNAFFAEESAKRYASFIAGQKDIEDITAAMTKRIEDGTADPTDAIVLFRLSLAKQDEETTRKALKALEKTETALALARANYEITQAFGTTDQQIVALQAVAQADSRMAVESLRSVARLQAESGDADAAMKTVDDLISRSPADAGLYALYADIATQGGKYDLAVIRLREAVRYVEDATSLRLQLANLLLLQGSNADASAILQEAFEKEEKDTRRMDIFRRQVELATQSGTLDDLTAALKEKQSREQNGARYGVYLAEIYMMDNNYIAAGEELSRSLGRNPDNAGAVKRLMDLADRSGDQQESLRLAARLVELEPSRDNRADYLARLFQTGELEQGKAEFEKARADILQDPSGWNAALMAMRKAGLRSECDGIVEEIARGKNVGAAQLTELARLRLLQRDFQAAEAPLWQALEAGNLAASLEAVANSTSKTNPYGMPGPWAYLQPFQQIAADVQNTLQMAFLPNSRGYYGSRMMMPGGMASAGVVTPEQKEQVRAIYLLNLLQQAAGTGEAFQVRLRKVMAEQMVPAKLQVILFMSLNDQEGVAALAKTLVDNPESDPDLDRLLMNTPVGNGPEAEKIRARLKKSDPQFAFDQRVAKIQPTGNRASGKMSEAERGELRKKIEELMNDPIVEKNSFSKAQVAALAGVAGDFPLAFRLMKEASAAVESGKSKTPMQQARMQLAMSMGTLLKQAIVQDDPSAAAEFEAFASNAPTPGSRRSVFYSGSVMHMGGSPANMLAQANPELVMGDASFPVPSYRMFTQFFQTPDDNKRLAEWLAKNAGGDELNAFTLSQIYSEWFTGKKAEALKRLEAIYARKPTPRTAALLLEAYERSGANEKALAVIELAALQDTETRDIRELRKLRLLRALGKVDEARTMAEQLAKARVSGSVRDQLANELNMLGVPLNKYPSLVNRGMRSVRHRDRGSQVREQLNKLVQEKKTDEAERIAIGILQRPLPGRDDHQEMNLRQNVISKLQEMNRLDGLVSIYQERLANDPGDVEASIRLAELSIRGDFKPAADQLAKSLTEHAERATNFDYAMQLMERNSGSQETALQVLCALLTKNPTLLATSGYQFDNLMRVASQASSGGLLAGTVASLDDEAYNAFMLPNRLSQRGTETMFLTQLAEFAMQDGKTDQAIALLQRAIKGNQVNIDMGLPSYLRLTELLLGQGRKEEASAVMRAFIETPPSRGNMFYGGNQNISNAIYNMMANRSTNSQMNGLILKLANLAEATGTLDILLAALDKQSGQMNMNISTSLMVRTLLKRPEIAKEWRDISLSAEPLNGYLVLPMLSTVLENLSEQPDGKKLIISLLEKVPQEQFFQGGDLSLTSLVDTLPVLSKYGEDPVVKRHIQMMVSRAMNDPNGGRHFAFSESYQMALLALVDAGYVEEARKLFEFTAAERATRNFGNMFQALEARLNATQNAQANVICAGEPLAADRLRVHWLVGVAPAEGGDENNPGSALWSDMKAALPKSARPQELEIYAGPNPCAMVSIGRKSKPADQGSIEAKVPPGYGLLQARWKLADGSVRWGSLTAYVVGENAVVDQGVPNTPASDSYKAGQAGPLGGRSAVRYEALSPRPDARLILGKVAVADKQIVVFSSWFKLPSRGYMSGIEVKARRKTGQVEDRSADSRNSAPGQWVQLFSIWSIGQSLPNIQRFNEDTEELTFSMRLNATSGYNNQYAVGAMWDGLQIVKLPAPVGVADATRLMQDAQAQVNSGEFDKAVESYLEAFKSDPYMIMQNSVSQLVTAFTKAGAMDKLYKVLSAPALYMPNPLRENHTTLRNSVLIERLVREALLPGAPASAKEWLRQLEGATLSDDLRYVVQAALLLERAGRDPGKMPVKDVLEVMGFTGKTVNKERLRNLWNSDSSANPTLELLTLLGGPDRSAEALALVKEAQMPVPFLNAKQMMEAWLTAPQDAGTALDLWRQAVGMRYGGENNCNVSEMADRAVINQIAQGAVEPGKLIAEVKNWLGRRYSNSNDVQRKLVEILYAIAISNSPSRERYDGVWADAEMAALKSPGYSVSRDRVRELASRLVAAEEWDRFDALLDVSKNNEALKSPALQREFAQQRDIVALMRGDIGKAWPVAWYKPGKTDKDITVCWQWNVKDMPGDMSKYDTVVVVAEKPVLKEVKGQSAVEIHFGEMPGEMKLLASVDGQASHGEKAVKLPSANGFLRVVSLVGDQRVPGPLVPVMNGKRIYPPGDTSLQDLLSSGSRPIRSQVLTVAGTAPDGAAAVCIGKKGDPNKFNYEGPEFPVLSGKFYVSRAWIRRAGEGTASAGSLYKAKKNVQRGTLNMILSESQGSTGQWVYYTRAVPALMSHTFWIPVDEVEFIVPLFSQIDPGTEIADMEFLEITGWKYADWIVELANLRKASAESDGTETIDRAIALAASEPLTALDYHGDWLVNQCINTGKTAQLAGLFQEAFAAEPNPLFSRPKLNRVFSALNTAVNSSSIPTSERIALIQIGLENADRTRPSNRIAYQTLLLKLAPNPESRAEILDGARRDFIQRLENAETGPAFLKAIVSVRDSRDARHWNAMLDFLQTLDDPELTRVCLQKISADKTLEPSDKIFAELVLEASLPEAKPDTASWSKRIHRGFLATEKGTTAAAYMCWPSLLGDLLENKGMADDLQMELRQRAFDRLSNVKEGDSTSLAETIRASAALLATSTSLKNSEVAARASDQLTARIRENSGKLSEDSLKTLLRTLQTLSDNGETKSVRSIVEASEPDIRRSPKMLASFKSYLPEANTSPGD